MNPIKTRRGRNLVPFLAFAVLLVVSSCAPSTPTAPKSAGYGKEIPGQARFPSLTTDSWIIDNGCGFSAKTVAYADAKFEALNREHIAQVAVVCQTGVQGGYTESSTWISEWLNHVGLGDLKDQRALAVLIRPDVPPEDMRITFNPNDALWWISSIDEFDPKHNAASYANYNDFSGCLEYLSQSIDEMLRHKWAEYGDQAKP